MRTIIGGTYGTYSFNAASKQITFSNLYEAVDIKNILEITNITRNKIIYLAENPATGGTLAGSVLTLTFDTTSYSDSDDLRIIYDYGIVKEKTLSTINNPSISIPSTVYQVSGSGTQVVSVQVDAGATYSFCIQQPETNVAFISAGGVVSVVGSNIITVPTTTGINVGQQAVSTTALAGSTFVKEINGNAVTLSVPAIASATGSILFTGGSFNVNFEASSDNSTWEPTFGIPRTVVSETTPISSAQSIGLWVVEAEPSHKYLRMVVTSLVSIPKLNLFIDSLNANSSNINLPFISGLTAAIPTGTAMIPAIDFSGLAEISVDVPLFGGTSQTITWKQTSDPKLATSQSLAHTTNNAAQNSAAITTTAAGVYRLAPTAKYFFAILTHTAITSMVCSGINAKVGSLPSILPVHITTNNVPVNLGQIGGQTPITLQPAGSTNRALVAALGGPVTLTAYSAQDWKAASGSGATIADTNGLGNTYSFDISVTAWTAGLSTGLVVSVEESTDGGTTWVKIYIAEPITSVSHLKIPALQINGRCRMTWINLNGAATTTTVTVTATGISRSVEKMYKFYDRTAGVGFNTSVVSTVTPAYGIVGTNDTIISVVALSGSGATFLPQFSIDGTNFFDGATTGTAIGSGAVTKQIAVDATANGPFVRVKCISGGSFISQIGIYAVN
jgi:hypothetical protein